MNFEQEIRSNCNGLGSDRVRVAQFGEVELSTITEAVLFVFASWSGSSKVSFKLLCDALMSSARTDFPLYVVDIDGVDYDAFKSTYGHNLNGNGETMWIKNGKVIAFDIGYTNKQKGMLPSSTVLYDRIGLLSSPEPD